MRFVGLISTRRCYRFSRARLRTSTWAPEAEPSRRATAAADSFPARGTSIHRPGCCCLRSATTPGSTVSRRFDTPPHRGDATTCSIRPQQHPDQQHRCETSAPTRDKFHNDLRPRRATRPTHAGHHGRRRASKRSVRPVLKCGPCLRSDPLSQRSSDSTEPGGALRWPQTELPKRIGLPWAARW